MPWLKCPNGDVFEIEKREYSSWGLLKRVANPMCPKCRKLFEYGRFQLQEGRPATIWVKCPNGDVFEMERLQFTTWGLMKRVSNPTCPKCHREYEYGKFQMQGDHASAVLTSDRAGKTTYDPITTEAGTVGRLVRLLKEPQYAKQCYSTLIKNLMLADLTANFPTPKIWSMLDMDESGQSSIRNMWSFDQDLNQRYAKERNQGENIFFGALNPRTVALDIMPEDKQRPFYTVLNVGRYHVGGAVNYGNSHLIFRDAVKLRATYTATDTLQMIKEGGALGHAKKTANPIGGLSDEVADYSNLPKILNTMSDSALKNFCKLNGFTTLDGAGVSDPEFIEAQVWGDLALRNDVRAIVISTLDLDSFPGEKDATFLPSSYGKLTKPEREQANIKFHDRLTKFCKAYGIKLYLLPISAGMDVLKQRTPLPS